MPGDSDAPAGRLYLVPLFPCSFGSWLLVLGSAVPWFRLFRGSFVRLVLLARIAIRADSPKRKTSYAFWYPL
jgi:hypothetical protein